MISEFSRELATYSQPTIETILRQVILEDTAEAIDTLLADATVADTIRPGGLRSFGAGLTPSTATTSFDKFIGDLKTLIAAVSPGIRLAIACNPAQAVTLAATPAPVPDFFIQVMPSAAIASGTLIMIDLDSLVFTSSAPIFTIADDVAIHEEDTSPLPIATGAQGSGVLATPTRSLWQTDVVGIRLLWWLNWVPRRSSAISWMSGVTW